MSNQKKKKKAFVLFLFSWFYCSNSTLPSEAEWAVISVSEKHMGGKEENIVICILEKMMGACRDEVMLQAL